MSRRAYEEVRAMVEAHGGKMSFHREGFSVGGAWVAEYDGKRRAFPSGGRRFPGIDDLLTPNTVNPKTWDDYDNVLIDNAWDKLLRLLNEPQ